MLTADGLRKHFRTGTGTVTALDGVSLSLPPGVRLGLTGPSGCGKSTLAAILSLLRPPDAGTVAVDGRAIDGFGLRAPAVLRRRVQLLWQSPRAAADPRQRLRDLVGEPAALARGAAPVPVEQWAARAGLPMELLDRYPHEVSEGQLQRACVARALACGPRYLVADEPTSMLDVSSQAAILRALEAAQEATGLGVLLITHDRDLVRHWCHDTLAFGDIAGHRDAGVPVT